MGAYWDNDFKQCVKCIFVQRPTDRGALKCQLTKGAARDAPVCKDYVRGVKPVAEKTEERRFYEKESRPDRDKESAGHTVPVGEGNRDPTGDTSTDPRV